MKVLRTDFNGTPNVGLFGYATTEYLLLGEALGDKLLERIKETLGVKDIHQVRVAGTDMPGLFLAGNSKVVLGPSIMFEREREALEKLKIPLKILETEQTCLGNNIVCNDKGAVISTGFSEEERAEIESLLGVPAVRTDIAGLSTPGAFIILNKDCGVIHRDATSEEIATVERTLGVKLQAATVNLGTPYLHAGIICNSTGLIVGDASGGPEIVHLDDALGGEE
ncbi:translation initiation factor IF-6 [Candidatus Woesearchaeota archaeon]|nr:translation initiation factor IF-6 [Candidatus Woesearchaeota archaeon]